VEKINYFKKW